MRALILVILLAGCNGTPEPKPYRGVFTDSSGHMKALDAAEARCSDLVYRAGEVVAKSGARVDAGYPGRLYVWCLGKSGVIY
jgi:hypothetical protein